MKLKIRPISFAVVREFKGRNADPLASHIYEGKRPFKWYGAYSEEDELVGFFGILQASWKLARLRGWYVLDEFRGKGIGTRLVRIFLEVCRRNGYQRVEVMTREHSIMIRAGLTATETRYPSWGGRLYKMNL